MRFEKEVIFVTGGAGFIGSAVVRHLLTDINFSAPRSAILLGNKSRRRISRPLERLSLSTPPSSKNAGTRLRAACRSGDRRRPRRPAS